MKFLLLLLLPLLLASCAAGDSPSLIVPIFVRINGDQLTKDFPPDSKQGWKDGCTTGYAVYGTNVYKTFNGFTRDATKVGNYGYETEWYNGYHYCRQAANTTYNQDIFW